MVVLQLVFQLANDEGKFSIDGEGRIRLLDTLDREERGSYNLTVTVSDRGQRPLSTTDYLFIEVTDVNDERPQLDRVRNHARPKEIYGANPMQQGLNVIRPNHLNYLATAILDHTYKHLHKG